MLALIIGYTLVTVFSLLSILFGIGACRQIGAFGPLRAILRLYGFSVFGFFALIAALLAGI